MGAMYMMDSRFRNTLWLSKCRHLAGFYVLIALSNFIVNQDSLKGDVGGESDIMTSERGGGGEIIAES